MLSATRNETVNAFCDFISDYFRENSISSTISVTLDESVYMRIHLLDKSVVHAEYFLDSEPEDDSCFVTRYLKETQLYSFGGSFNEMLRMCRNKFPS